MKELSDKTLATRMLQAHHDGGYRFISFVRMNARGYSFLAVYFGAILAGSALMQAWPVVIVVAGILFGVLLRDVSWVVGVNRTWPFVVKVTNWDAVRKLSDEDENQPA